MPQVNAIEWDAFLTQYPNAHLLQTTGWGDLKAVFGWNVVRLVSGNTGNNNQNQYKPVGVQILFRHLPLGFNLAYIPKGPIGNNWEVLIPEIDHISLSRRTVFLLVEPDLWSSHEEEKASTKTQEIPPPAGFRLGSHSIQPIRTLIIDLTGDEASVLNRMKQKTRYNIKLAQKKGVIVQPSADLETFHRLLKITSQRDRFGIHNLNYYRRAYELFHPRGMCELLIASYQDEPLAGLMVFAQGQRAWYFYGASASDHRDRMPTYLTQWEAMRWARAHGCTEYDMWGVPDTDEEILEANFNQRSGGLWGIYRFKRGFGGKLSRSIGPWDRVYIPSLYHLYLLLIKVNRE